MNLRFSFLLVPLLALGLLAGCASDSSDSEESSGSAQTASLEDCQKGDNTTY